MNPQQAAQIGSMQQPPLQPGPPAQQVRLSGHRSRFCCHFYLFIRWLKPRDLHRSSMRANSPTRPLVLVRPRCRLSHLSGCRHIADLLSRLSPRSRRQRAARDRRQCSYTTPRRTRCLRARKPLSTALYIYFRRACFPFLMLTIAHRVQVNDALNASPRFMRMSMYSVPTSGDVMRQIKVPLGAVVTPMATLLNGEPGAIFMLRFPFL